MKECTFALQPDAGLPLYEQLYRYFVSEIRTGRLREGEKLPSKRTLCERLSLSRSTVETALGLLAAEGYVRTAPRSGVYVCAAEPLLEQAQKFSRQSGEGFSPAARSEKTSCAAAGRTGIAQSSASPVAATPEEEISFSTGAVDTSLFPYSSWARINREIVQANPALLQRGDRQGDYALRATLAGLLHQYRGVSCAPEQIVVGAGMEYLLNVLTQLLPPETVYALENPGYNATYRTLANNRLAVAPIPLDEAGMRVDALRDSAARVAYVTPSHQFPLGVTMSATRRAQLLSWAREAEGRYIVEDDYDSEFRYLTRPIPAMQGLDGNGRVVYIGTFSRSIAPSIRVAYMVLPEALYQRYLERFDYAASTVSRFEQHTLNAFIERGLYARHLRRVGALYKKRWAYLTRLLTQLPGTATRGGGAGLHFLLTVPKYGEAELVARARARGVRLHGLTEYAHGGECLPSTLVLGFAGLDEREMERACARLREAWAL